MTQERALPVLEAAHIQPYAAGGQHELSNGLCLRSDLHKLFDHGYITVDPKERRIVVSKRIREEFENGREITISFKVVSYRNQRSSWPTPQTKR